MNSARRVASRLRQSSSSWASTGCGPAAVAPSPTVAPATVVSPSPAVSSSPGPSPVPQADRMTIAGSSEAGSLQQITVKLPRGWENNDMAAARGSAGPPEGMGFRVSLVDNTFKGPYAHVGRNQRLDPTVDALTTALGEIPNATATKPVREEDDRRAPGNVHRACIPSVAALREVLPVAGLSGRGLVARRPIGWSIFRISRRTASALLFPPCHIPPPPKQRRQSFRESSTRSCSTPRLSGGLSWRTRQESATRYQRASRVRSDASTCYQLGDSLFAERPLCLPARSSTYRPTSYQLFERCAKVFEHDLERARVIANRLMSVSIGYS